MMYFVFKMMYFVSKMMDFVSKMMYFVFKMMDFVSKMMDRKEPEVEAGADYAEEDEEGEDEGPISRALALQLQTESTVLGGEEASTGSLPRRGGRWAWCIGLVGKPSAGKSTFFNAVAGSELAKVGATPFTTINPNVHQAVRFYIDCVPISG